MRVRILKEKLNQDEIDLPDDVAGALVQAGFAQDMTDPAVKNPNDPEAQQRNQTPQRTNANPTRSDSGRRSA